MLNVNSINGEQFYIKKNKIEYIRCSGDKVHIHMRVVDSMVVVTCSKGEFFSKNTDIEQSLINVD